MWTCKQCGGENPDSFAFCPGCGSARPAPERPTVGRHMRPEDRENAERNVDDSFWAGLEEALKEEEEEEEAAAPVIEAEKEAEEPEKEKRSPLLLALLIFAFLLIVFSTVMALILIDRTRNGAQEDVVVEDPTPTAYSALNTPATGSDGETEGVVVAGIMEENPTVTPYPVTTPYPAAATPMPVSTLTPVYTPAPTVAPTQTQSYILADSDKRYLTEADLGRLSWEECSLARNEIYARHGFTFGVKALSDYFNSQPWYVPGGFNENDLNQYERENAAFILEYEKAHYGGSRY